MEKIALLPGGFKPPHAGHYNMAKWLAVNTDADTVIVKVGAKEREGITREMSLKLWDLYRSTDSDPASNKLTIIPSKHNSPVKDTYEYIENKDGKGAPEGSTIYLAMGEKEIKTNDQRFANIGKFADPRDITFKTKLVPPQAGGVSGTDMRDFIKSNDQYSFFEFIPDHLTSEQKEQAWQIVTTKEVSDWKPGDPVSFEMWTSDWNLKGFGKEYDSNFKNREAAVAYYKPNKAEDWAFKSYAYVAKKISGFGGGLEEDLYNPEDKVLDYMRGSEWKAGMPDGPKDDIPRALKYKRGGKYNAATGQGGGGTMYENLSKELPIEIMNTPELQIQGMMGRDSLEGGMLFPYEEVGERSFHMKNCLIPLDIVFTAHDEITNIHPNCPPCLEDNCPQYTGIADNVLELPGGYCQQNNINIGDYIPRSGNRIHNSQTAPVSWEESVNESRGGESELHIYDFDETIARVETPIPYTVESPEGKIIEKGETTSIDFEKTKDFLKDTYDEGIKINWDFKAFANLISKGTLNNEVFQKLLKSIKNPNAKVTILTARAVGLPVTKFLNDQGIWAYVVPLGLNKEKGQPVTGEDKANWIENRIKDTTKKVLFIDDSSENRKAIYTLRDKYPNIEFDVENPLKNKLNELSDGEIKIFATHSDILKQLFTSNFKLKFLELHRELEGERLNALEYFWEEYFSNLDDSCEIEGAFDKKLSESQINEELDLLEEGILDAIKKGTKAVSEFVISNIIPTLTNLVNQAANASNKVVDFVISALKRIFNAIKRFKDKHPKLFFAIVAFIVFVIVMLISSSAQAADPQGMNYNPQSLDAMIGLLDGSRDAIQSTTDTVTFQGQTLVVPKYDESIILQTTQYLKDLQDGTLQFGEYGKHVREVASNTQEYFEFLKDVGNDASDPLTNKAMDVLIRATEFGQNTVVKSFSTTVHETKYGAHDMLSQYKDQIKDPQQYRDLQLMISQQKDEEVNNWINNAKKLGKLKEPKPHSHKAIKPSFNNKAINETSVFSKDWWKDQLTEVLTETKANTHLTHLEELVLTQGQDGYNQARTFLFELIKNLKGEDNSIKNVSVKWDGAPAVWAGINPENGKFFVGIKGIFNKITPKINYTPQDIDKNHGHSADLAKKLKLALQYLPALGIKGILQGDFMFDGDDVETKNIDGIPHYTFEPNTITYAVEANSEIGKQIIAAKIGVIWHTTYKDLSSESGASFGVDISGLSKSPSVWFDDAYFKDDTGILLSDKEEKFVLEKINKADSINVDYTNLPLGNLNTYLNSEVRQGEFVSDPYKSFKRFKNWYQQAVNKSIEKVKRLETKEKKRLAGELKIKEFESQKENIINIFNVSKLLSQAKSIFITKYDDAVATKHFIDNGDGTLSVTKAEGFVAVDHTENGIKLVDRLEFSKNNFNAGKPGAKK